MTDNEIIKALELCIRGDKGDCSLCPMKDDDCCKYDILTESLDLINRQKAEIERLREAKVVYATVDDSLGDLEEALKEIEALRKSHNELIVKNREQEEEIAHLKCLTIVGEVREIPIKCEKLACISWEHPLVEAVKSEAIKEFAERLKCTPFPGLIDGGIGFVIHKDIDNLVKEMTEEQK